MQRKRLLYLSVLVLLSPVVILEMSVEAEDAQPKKSEPLIRAEQSTDTGWLLQYDYNQHRDLGRATAAYFEAYRLGDPEKLVREGMLRRKDVSLDELAKVWRERPLQAEPEPFAVDFVARDGRLEAVTFTRVVYDGKLDAYILAFRFADGRWFLDPRGLTTGFYIQED